MGTTLAQYRTVRRPGVLPDGTAQPRATQHGRRDKDRSGMGLLLSRPGGVLRHELVLGIQKDTSTRVRGRRLGVGKSVVVAGEGVAGGNGDFPIGPADSRQGERDSHAHLWLRRPMRACTP